MSTQLTIPIKVNDDDLEVLDSRREREGFSNMDTFFQNLIAETAEDERRQTQPEDTEE